MVGKINGIFGIQGWVKILSHTHPRKNILSYQPWHIRAGDKWQTLEVIKGREQGKTLVAQIQNFDSPEQAKSLIGVDVYIEKSQLPALKKGEYYWQDLIGMTVVNKEKIVLGKVSNLMETESNNVLVIKGKKPHLVPYISPFLIKVDMNHQQILVDWDADF